MVWLKIRCCHVINSSDPRQNFTCVHSRTVWGNYHIFPVWIFKFSFLLYSKYKQLWVRTRLQWPVCFFIPKLSSSSSSSDSESIIIPKIHDQHNSKHLCMIGYCGSMGENLERQGDIPLNLTTERWPTQTSPRMSKLLQNSTLCIITLRSSSWKLLSSVK